MFILASHEFGHYFAARAHGVEASLPRFLPFPPLLGTVGLPNFGTLGAVIKTKTEVASRRALFDVGAAGPIAGFVATLIVLAYGFTHLPSVEFLLDIHPDYFADDYLAEGAALTFGDSLLFAGMRAVLPSATDFVPPMTEVYHYPFLNAGWFGLFITAMNLIPVGQLDGGHIAAARLGRRGHIKVAAFSMIALVAMGAAGAITALGSDYGWFDYQFGWGGWLFWAGLLYFFVRVEHPPLAEEEPLDPKRRAVAYLALAIFALSFAPSPLYIAPTG
ncbi:MAG: site-2 protease family protein [Ignavibacteriales bacterium]|nr:site-2 protease family protein [Ignavibacteriales bacterium]